MNLNADFVALDDGSGPPRPAFVGGAERARRNARKRRYDPRQQRPSGGSSNKRRGGGGGNRYDASNISPYPKSMREYDRFFGALLTSSAADIGQSEANEDLRRRVVQRACSLLNVPSLLPPVPSVLERKFSSSDGSIDARSHHLLQRSSSFLSAASSRSTASQKSTKNGTFDNAKSYYNSLSPSIIEESRCIIADSMAKVECRIKRSNGSSITLKLLSTEERCPKLSSRQRENAPLVLNFQILENTSSKKQQCGGEENSMKWTRPGSVLLLRRKYSEKQKKEKSVLACVVPNGSRQSSSSTATPQSSWASVSLMVFRREDLDLSELEESPSDDSDSGSDADDARPMYDAYALTTLISQVRMIEACLRMVKVSFMQKLLGQKGATHIRFGGDSSDDDEEEVVGGIDDGNGGDDMANATLQEGFYVDEGESDNSDAREPDEDACDDTLSGLLESIPNLNKIQELAARSFLDSPKESLILVQGPPGTGKSTFLVNVICRRLAYNPSARMLVTAPTNKAVTVLAERFLDAIHSADDRDNLSSKLNAVLIGVEDKLMSPSSKGNKAEYFSVDSMSSSLRGIFVYNWLETLRGQCEALRADLKCKHHSRARSSIPPRPIFIEQLISRAQEVKAKIFSSIPSERGACGYAKSLLQQLKTAAAAELWEDSIEGHASEDSASTASLEQALFHADSLIKLLDEMESPVQELLATARVIFCTLSTAGASIIKQTPNIDDLLVDEAACATEAEICIPFHLRPARMLAVGDPLQLPPTIMSKHAAQALGTSMHERLMNQCGTKYFMLDHQYRMKPHISHFPCRQFYNGRISNGKNVMCTTYTSKVALQNHSPYLFIDVRGQEYQMHPGGSYANDAECETILDLVKKLSLRRVQGWHAPDRLRIICFYQGQVSRLKSFLAKNGFGNVLVATVDSSQGCEADVVIISFVRASSKKGARRAAGFLCDDRRVNVALTRARHQLICVGDAIGTLEKEGSPALKNLVEDARQRGYLLTDM